ncbi:MAG: serine/threonine-protein kinase [Acidobacteriota bacterium]
MGDAKRPATDESVEAATVVDGPGRRNPSAVRRPPSPSPVGLAPAVADDASFARALRRAEVARTRRFVPVVILMGLVAATMLPFVGGDPFAKHLLEAGIACATIASGYLYWLARHVDRFTEGRVAIAYAVCIAAVFTGVIYWGIFSPAAAIVGLGIFFVTLGRSTWIGLGLYLFAMVSQAVLAAGAIDHWWQDVGLIGADRSSRTEQILQQVMLQVVYAVIYVIARATRNQLDTAVSDHDRAVRAVAQREALLAEARQELEHALRIGGRGRYSDQVVGSFRLGIVIGRGAMGDVYEAVQIETGANAAVKLLASAALAIPGQLARFYREARAAAQLTSPHIVLLLAVSGADDPVPYLAMERLRGHNLAEILRDRQRLVLPEVVELAQHVARGLEVAREAGVVHRDIKPQNLFHAEVGGGARVWKILDFGISQLGDHHGTLTKGQIVGTPMYMAPEQARGEPVDHRSDVLALATVCYRAITGQPPYTGRDVPTILYNVVYRVPACPSDLVRVPRDVDRVLALGLAKRPADRFATAIELAEALAAAVAGRLAADVRARADATIASHPWGSGG